jgi:hypothetical protein
MNLIKASTFAHEITRSLAAVFFRRADGDSGSGTRSKETERTWPQHAHMDKEHLFVCLFSPALL